MVVQFNDEPDIIIGRGGAPSAPPIATAVPATAFNINNPNKTIERMTNADGSLTVKATTTSRQPNDYRDITIEYFYVPANMANTVIMSMDSTGEPPSSLYLTKMEQQVLPPGTGAPVSHAPSSIPQATTVTAATAGGGATPAGQPYIHENAVVGTGNGGRGCAIGCGICILIVVIIGIIAAATRTNHTYSPNRWPTPAPYAWNPTPWNPPTPSFPTPYPTRVGCKDTPNWEDSIGFGCWYYKTSTIDVCRLSGSREGPMGSANENCCGCGGGSTYVPPANEPSISPVVPTPTKAPSVGKEKEDDANTSNTNLFRSPSAAKED